MTPLDPLPSAAAARCLLARDVNLRIWGFAQMHNIADGGQLGRSTVEVRNRAFLDLLRRIIPPGDLAEAVVRSSLDLDALAVKHPYIHVMFTMWTCDAVREVQEILRREVTRAQQLPPEEEPPAAGTA